MHYKNDYGCPATKQVTDKTGETKEQKRLYTTV